MYIGNSKLLSFASHCLGFVERLLPPYSSKFSRRDYTQHQLATLVCLMRKYKPKYRDFIELLEHMDSLQTYLKLKKVPHFTTLNKFFLRMRTFILSLMLELSAGRCSGKGAIDSTGFDRRHASKHYVKRAKMKLKAVKSTLLVDTGNQKILGMHATTTRKHDSKIIGPLAKKTKKRHKVRSLSGDCGYDSKEVRKELRELGIRPLIKHREFTSLQRAWNARMNKKEYNQRWLVETANSVIKRKYSDCLSSRSWWNQFKELKLLALIYNIDVELRKFFSWIIGFLQSNSFLFSG